jgi:hypothetical protein
LSEEYIRQIIYGHVILMDKINKGNKEKIHSDDIINVASKLNLAIGFGKAREAIMFAC